MPNNKLFDDGELERTEEFLRNVDIQEDERLRLEQEREAEQQRTVLEAQEAARNRQAEDLAVAQAQQAADNLAAAQRNQFQNQRQEQRQQEQEQQAQPIVAGAKNAEQIIDTKGHGWKDAFKQTATNIKNALVERLKGGRTIGRGIYALIIKPGIALWPVIKYIYQNVKELNADKISTLLEERLRNMAEFQALGTTPEGRELQDKILATNWLINQKIGKELQDRHINTPEESRAYFENHPEKFKEIYDKACWEANFELEVKSKLSLRPAVAGLFDEDGKLIDGPPLQKILRDTAINIGTPGEMGEQLANNYSASFASQHNSELDKQEGKQDRARQNALNDLQKLPLQIRVNELNPELAGVGNVIDEFKRTPQDSAAIQGTLQALESLPLSSSLKAHLTDEIAKIKIVLRSDPLTEGNLAAAKACLNDLQNTLLDQELTDVQNNGDNLLHQLYNDLKQLEPESLKPENLGATIERIAENINADDNLSPTQKQTAHRSLNQIKEKLQIEEQKILAAPVSIAIKNTGEEINAANDGNNAIYNLPVPPERNNRNLLLAAAEAYGFTAERADTPEGRREQSRIASNALPGVHNPRIDEEVPGAPRVPQ